jgi:hypothetical protein
MIESFRPAFNRLCAFFGKQPLDQDLDAEMASLLFGTAPTDALTF